GRPSAAGNSTIERQWVKNAKTRQRVFGVIDGTLCECTASPVACRSFLRAPNPKLVAPDCAEPIVPYSTFSNAHSNNVSKVSKERFMPADLSPDVIRLIDGRNFAHLATLRADGSPHSAPVWIGREGNRLYIATDDNSVKGRNTKRDPRVAISVVDLDDPYSEAQIRGRVVERRRDSDF